MPKTDSKLLLDPNTVVLPAEGSLLVFSRRGFTKIQARQIDELHERVKRYLNGAYQEQELIAAVPARKRKVLRRYLRAMSQAEALQRAKPPAQHSVPPIKEEFLEEELQQPSGGVRLCVNGKTAIISLAGTNGDRTHRCNIRVLFLNSTDMNAEWARLWRMPRTGPHLLYLVTEFLPASPHQLELDRLKPYAALILRCLRFDQWKTRTIQIYSLDSTKCALSLLFTLTCGHRSGKTATKPELIDLTDAAQVPLVVAKASVPFYSNIVAGYGLQYHQLAEQLEREFIVRAVLSTSTRRLLVETSRPNLDPSEPRKAHVDCKDAIHWPIGDSLEHVRLRALESLLWEIDGAGPPQSSSEVDLLQLSNMHPQIAYLIDILRVRLQAVPASIHILTGALYLCRSGKHHAYSLIQAKAIRDVLLATVRDEFYGASLNETPVKHDCDFAGFATEDDLRQIFLRRTEELSKRKVARGFLFQRFHHYGITAWIGKFCS